MSSLSHKVLLSIPVLLGLWYLYESLGLNWITLCLVITSLLVLLAMRGKDPYGSFHLALNASGSRGKSEGRRPPTEWLNMGYWKDTNAFPEACEGGTWTLDMVPKLIVCSTALALKVTQAGGCKAGGSVLDVGYGSGDSLLVQLSHPSVPRPARLTGITSLKAHYDRSLERVEALRSQHTEVNLYHGDAIYHTPETEHPLDPASTSASFTTILAVDCAYHFRTREDFLRQSYSRLASGGKIALADICFSTASAGPSGTFANFLIRQCGLMPSENIVTVREYIGTMERIGYVDVKSEDISEYVFPGFRGFLAGQGVGWRIFSWMIGGLHSSGARFVIVSGTKT